MTWRVWATPYENASDLTYASIYQPFDPVRNMLLKACKTWILLINDPVLTSVNMKVYTDSGGTPDTLIATSESVTKSEIATLDNAIKEVPFIFATPVALTSGTTYHLVINGSGYSPTSSSYFCWRRAYPNPVYTDGYTPTTNNAIIAPHEVSLIGADY